MNVISYSLWGTGSMYLRGMMLNLREAPKVYPGWKIRVYCDEATPIKSIMREWGAEVVVCPQRGGIYIMFCRFLAASDPEVERVIVRDADSVVNVREAAAVAEWIDSGKTAHRMKDHLHHLPPQYPVFGGMWGIKGGVIKDMQKRIDAWGKWSTKPEDMHFLTHSIWPEIRNDCMCHSFQPQGEERPFPPHSPYRGFVGQQLHDMPWLN